VAGRALTCRGCRGRSPPPTAAERGQKQDKDQESNTELTAAAALANEGGGTSLGALAPGTPQPDSSKEPQKISFKEFPMHENAI
jgi:hypothetical protein